MMTIQRSVSAGKQLIDSFIDYWLLIDIRDQRAPLLARISSTIG